MHIFSSAAGRRMGLLVALAILLMACVVGQSGTASPDANLVATQVALTFTQTAVAGLVSPAASPQVQPTAVPPTAMPPTPIPPTAVSPTATLPAMPPPYDGACTASMLAAPSTTPTPGNWPSYRGYRHLGLPVNNLPYEGFLLSTTPGDSGKGFAITVYRTLAPGQLVFFLDRMVCYNGNQPYWEVADVIALPQPGTNQAIVVTPALYASSNHFWDPATADNPMALMGAVLSLECVAPLEPYVLARIQVAPANLPATYDGNTRVPVQVLQAWAINFTTQRFEPLDMKRFGACEALFP